MPEIVKLCSVPADPAHPTNVLNEAVVDIDGAASVVTVMAETEE